MARVGYLGGTFNPPHIGHLVCAAAAREALGLDCVRLLPAATPPHKAVLGDPGAEVRLALCELAVAGETGIEVSRAELDRPGPSYSVDTLRALRERGGADELWFVVGGDMALAFPSWREPEAILALARLAIAERDGARREEIAGRLAGLDGAAGRLDFFDMPRLDISSSALRERIAAGRTVRHLVPAAVEERVHELGLYGAPTRAGERAWA